MAVFTHLDEHDITSIVAQYDLGSLVRSIPISAGTENSNFFIDCDKGLHERRWVLTLFENINLADIPFFVSLLVKLDQANILVPAPAPKLNGGYVFQWNGKQGVIVPCLAGAPTNEPTVDQCRQLGSYLAKIHGLSGELTLTRTQAREQRWFGQHLDALRSVMPEDRYSVLVSYVARYRDYRQELEACPKGIVHGDLFKDNVFFDDNGNLSGIIDFYHACTDVFLFDLAVAVNDWCYRESQFDVELVNAMLSGYRAVREWEQQEVDAWPLALELAGLRFWTSRLATRYLQSYQQGAEIGTASKDPDGMYAVLQAQAELLNELSL